jgi:predicted DNA-binding ribbon-helix-helix protein
VPCRPVPVLRFRNGPYAHGPIDQGRRIEGSGGALPPVVLLEDQPHGADPAFHKTSTRSMRLHGVVTNIRLETLFWSVLADISRRDGMSLSHLITKLYDEIIEARGEVENFTSFLRVCCLRYLSLQISGCIPVDVSVPIRSLDANAVLAHEQGSYKSTVPAA